MSQQPEPEHGRRIKDSAQLKWDTKPRRAPNPRDIEFQTAEVVISNPAVESGQVGLASLLDGSAQSAQNRLIWGDCLLACQALLAQGYEGRIDLIYIDPPFKSDEDYSHEVTLNARQSVTRVPSMLERLAYRDMWVGGVDSYLDMLYPRLQLMRRLLADHGSLYVHIGSDVAAYVKVVLDEIFGRDRLQAEIIWQSVTSHNDAKTWGMVHQYIYHYSKSDRPYFDMQRKPLDASYIQSHYTEVESDGRRYRIDNLTSPNPRPNLTYEWKGHEPPPKGWRYSREKMAELDAAGLIWYPADKSKRPGLKRFLTKEGAPIHSIWDDISPVNSQAREDTGYDTQKPEELMRRIISASSKPGDLVADFFLGSGTTAVVAEKLGRRWIGADFGKTGIQVSRSRLVEAEARPFVLQNLGNYQREMIYLTGSRIGEVQRVILKLYGAEPRSDAVDLGVHRADDGAVELVYVGYPDRQVTARKAEELLQLAERLDGPGYRTVVILGWDYDLNYNADLETRLGQAKPPYRAQIHSRAIPPYIYDYLRQMRDESDIEALRPKIHFAQTPYVRVRAEAEGPDRVNVSIERYVVFDVPVANDAEREQVLAAAKDNFAFLIDYWAIDSDYDGKTFRSTWQAFRGNGRKPKTVPTSVSLTRKGSGRIAVRLVDIFGNDASAMVSTIVDRDGSTVEAGAKSRGRGCS
jgi:adenine-specific DNA-methyltransferase